MKNDNLEEPVIHSMNESMDDITLREDETKKKVQIVIPEAINLSSIQNSIFAIDSPNEESDERLLAGMNPKTTLPPTGKARVDKDKLKNMLARGSLEMEKCINKGENPVFGYPMVCFSPNNNEKTNDNFWQKLYTNTLRAKKVGHRSSLIKCLDKYDEFHKKQENLLSDFSRGRYNSNSSA